MAGVPFTNRQSMVEETCPETAEAFATACLFLKKETAVALNVHRSLAKEAAAFESGDAPSPKQLWRAGML